MNHFEYSGRKTHEISFPLGGIGSGCIGLGGNGRLIDWEIFNRPSKGSFNGFSHFAIRAERAGKLLDARVLNSDLPPPYSGSFSQPQFQSFGFGPPNKTMAGLPHFRDSRFIGTFPIAEIEFIDESFPGTVSLTAFNPFIPLNDLDSSIPAAFFEIEITNSGNAAIDYTIAGTLSNPLPAPNLNQIGTDGGGTFLSLRTSGVDPGATEYGDLCLATDAQQTSHQEFWYRGQWSDNLETYWRDLTTLGHLKNRSYGPDLSGRDNTGTIAAHVSVAPGESERVRFLIAWSFPNCENYWDKSSADRARAAGIPPVWKNYYATVWDGSRESAGYCLANWERLFAETKLFRDTLFASTLPPVAIDAVSSTLSVLKTPTVLRLTDGTFYGWEGCHPAAGCCEGSCTHVWNYAQALPFLFPKLERSMREADYRYNQLPSGGMPFRMRLPLGVIQQAEDHFRPCADGQFGDVMKVYRDWKISGDTSWLRGLWPAVERSIAYAWNPANYDRWDPDRTGVLWGRQHHTLDMELFGPNSWLTGLYLGALKAGAEMAEALGEQAAAEECRALFERGRSWMDEHLYNGEYYFHQIDLADRSILKPYDALGGDVWMGGSASQAYWSDEHGQIKYQIGEGSGIDQVLAQWHANLYGLGDIYDPEQCRSAIAAVFRHNFQKPMRDYYNPFRLFCLNDEGGLVIADWPEGVFKPAIPVPYSQETMHGFEYSAAVLMIQCGLIDEGMTVVESVRERYDGERRNPWNEIECGSNYARSMASYSLLNAFSGFRFDMTQGMIGFDPIRFDDAGEFRCFWSLDCAWGEYAQKGGEAEIAVLSGQLSLKRAGFPFAPAAVTLGGKSVAFSVVGNDLSFDTTQVIEPGAPLVVVG